MVKERGTPSASGGDGSPEGLEGDDGSPVELGEGAQAENGHPPDGTERESEEVVEDGRLGPGEELSDEDLRLRVAVLLFASAEPLTLRRLVDLLERPRVQRVRAALEALGRSLGEAGLPFALDGAAGRLQLLSDPAHGETVQRLQKEVRPERITQAALETLAIVAYRQPVTKAEVDAIRGVQSGAMLRGLVDRDLVKIVGRADQPGSPLQYGTTREFLQRFGLRSLKDLPRDAELAGE